MKKTVFKLTSLCLILASGFLFASCSSENPYLGTWVPIDKPALEKYANDFVSKNNLKAQDAFGVKFLIMIMGSMKLEIDDKNLTISMPDFSKKGALKKEKVSYEIVDNVLVAKMTSKSGKDESFEIRKSDSEDMVMFKVNGEKIKKHNLNVEIPYKRAK